jgi:hypothetical protein
MANPIITYPEAPRRWTICRQLLHRLWDDEKAPDMDSSSEKTSFQKLLRFFEKPLFTLPVGILCGLIGMFYYWPILIICGICILLAFHRAKVVSGKKHAKQFTAYVLLFIITTGFLYGIGRVIDRGAHNF